MKKPKIIIVVSNGCGLSLSSTVKGGKYFAFDVTGNDWQTPKGVKLLIKTIKSNIPKLYGKD